MSAEAFQTVMSCDMRTAPDGRSAEYAEAGTRQPRWLNWDGTINRDSTERPWATCYLYAENAVRIAADAVRDQPMTGETGDHPNMRRSAARILDAAAALVRELALDHACDAHITNEKYQAALDKIVIAVGDAREYGDEEGIQPVLLELLEGNDEPAR